MRQITIVAVSLLILLSACGTAEQSLPSAQKVNISETFTETIPKDTVADGSDILGGFWTVGAVRYNDKIIDVQDSKALNSLYDNTYLEFCEDGTFTYTNLWIYKGEYAQSNTQENSFILTRHTEIAFKDGEWQTEPYCGNIKHILHIVDQSTIEVSEYDPITGTAKIGTNPILFVKQGKNSNFIEDHKTTVPDSTTETIEKHNNHSAQYSYAKIVSTYTQKMNEAVPRLVSSYQSESAGISDIEHLAEICNSKIEELAKICNDGIEEMAKLMYSNGDSYSVYERWSGELMDNYLEIAQDLQNAYLDSIVP